jgi:lambda family phage tail tape measure protein
MSDQTLASLGIKFATEGVDTSLSDMKRLLTGAENTYNGIAESRLLLSQKTIAQLALEKEGVTRDLAIKAEQATKEIEIETQKQAKLRALSGYGFSGSSNTSSMIDDSTARAAKQKELSDTRKDREKLNSDHILAIAENESRMRISIAHETALRMNATMDQYYANQASLAEMAAKRSNEISDQQLFHEKSNNTAYRNNRISMYTQMFNEIEAKEKASAEETKKRATETHGHLDRLMMRTASIVAAMASYRIISAFIEVPAEILKTNIEMEKLRVLLEGVTGSVQNARLEFNRLLALDIKTPFDIKGLTETFVMLKNYGLEPTDMVMKSLTDSVAKLGGSTEQLIGIGRQLGQAWAKDKLQQIDMRPMIENGLPVISLLASALKTSTSEILAMSKAGTIGRQEMLLLFAEMQKDAPNAAARNMDTLRGSLSNVTTAWTQFQDAILEDKSEGVLKRIFESWSSMLFKWRDDISGIVNQTNAMAENLMKLESVRSQMPIAQKNPIAAELMSLSGLGYTYAELVEKERELLFTQDKILTAMEKESLAAYKLKDTSESKLELDKKALELSEKQEKALIRQLEFEGKINQSKMELANALIDAQIKDEQRLNTTKVAGYELERKQNDEALSRNEISAKRRYDVEIDLIQKLKAAELQKLNEIESLEKQKIATKVLDVDKAWLAILEIEDKSGKKGTVNTASMAMGPGQAMPRTLAGINEKGEDVGVGFGVARFKPAVDENLMGMLGDYNKIKDFATRHDAELKEWSERYWKALVLNYGSVEEALKHYGDGTVKYSKDVMAAYSMITGATKDQIKLDSDAKDTLDDRAKAVAKYAAMEQDARNKLIKSSYEYQKMLEEESLKTIQITGTSKQYRDANLAYQEKYNVELQKAIAIQDKVGEAIIRTRMAAENKKPIFDLQKENDLIIKNEDAQSKFNDQLSKARNLLDDGVINETEFNKEMGRLAQSYNENFVDPVETYTKRMSQFAIQAARNMQSGFAQFLYDPFKNGLKGMLSGFIDMLRKMAAEAAAAQIFDRMLGVKNSAGVSSGGWLGTLASGIMGAFGSANMGGQSIYSSTTGLGTAGPNYGYADGGVVSGKGISAYSGSVVSSPTVFPFANGTGLMGEAGPEAILPLKRTPSGSLGVQTSGNKSSGDTINNVTINVQAAKEESASDIGQKTAEAFMRTIAKQEITNANRPGNQLNRTTTFGA